MNTYVVLFLVTCLANGKHVTLVQPRRAYLLCQKTNFCSKQARRGPRRPKYMCKSIFVIWLWLCGVEMFIPHPAQTLFLLLPIGLPPCSDVGNFANYVLTNFPKHITVPKSYFLKFILYKTYISSKKQYIYIYIYIYTHTYLFRLQIVHLYIFSY